MAAAAGGSLGASSSGGGLDVPNAAGRSGQVAGDEAPGRASAGALLPKAQPPSSGASGADGKGDTVGEAAVAGGGVSAKAAAPGSKSARLSSTATKTLDAAETHREPPLRRRLRAGEAARAQPSRAPQPGHQLITAAP